MADNTYNAGVYRVQGSSELVVASSGAVRVESGGKIDIDSGGYADVNSGGYIKMSTGSYFCSAVYKPTTTATTTLNPSAVNVIERDVDSQTIYMLPQPTYAGQKCSVILTKTAGSSCWVYIMSTGAGLDSTGSTNLRIVDNNQSVDLIAIGTTRWAILNKTTGVTILAAT